MYFRCIWQHDLQYENAYGFQLAHMLYNYGDEIAGKEESKSNSVVMNHIALMKEGCINVRTVLDGYLIVPKNRGGPHLIGVWKGMNQLLRRSTFRH